MQSFKQVLIVLITSIVIAVMMTIDVSFAYTFIQRNNLHFLLKDDYQCLIHFVIFIVFTALSKNVKIAILAAISFELIQLLTASRAFQMIDLLSNIAGVYTAQILLLHEKNLYNFSFINNSL